MTINTQSESHPELPLRQRIPPHLSPRWVSPCVWVLRSQVCINFPFKRVKYKGRRIRWYQLHPRNQKISTHQSHLGIPHWTHFDGPDTLRVRSSKYQTIGLPRSVGRLHIILSAVYLAGVQNSLAESFSRHFSTDNEWEIRNSILNEIPTQWGTPSWDVFASQENKTTHCYRAALGCSLKGGALDNFRYTFPPISLMLQVHQKICHDTARIILIVPNWLRQFWFSKHLRV